MSTQAQQPIASGRNPWVCGEANALFPPGHHSIKCREAAACRRGQTEFPSFDVFLRPDGARRGRHVFTIVYWPEFAA